MDASREALATGLLDAQVKAQALFEEIDARNLIRRGAKECDINEGIYALAERMYLFPDGRAR